MGEYKQNMLNVSSGYYSEIEQFTLKNKLQPLIQIDGNVTDIVHLQHIYHCREPAVTVMYLNLFDSCYIKQMYLIKNFHIRDLDNIYKHNI